MMAYQKKDKPDDSSIKPVSSLRAQFEDISIGRGPSPSRGFKPTHLSNVEQERGRSSLDMPRGTSTWIEESQPAVAPPAINTSTMPASRPFTAELSSRQRPMSMGQWATPKLPPAVIVQSPKSPPKSTREVMDTGEGHGWAFQRPSEPPKRQIISASPNRSSQSRSMTTSKLSHELPVNIRETSPGGLKRAPPPINRASKPGTPIGSSFSKGLGIIGNESKDKISPFSTPPSSDESPVRNENSAYQPIAAARSDKNSSYFPPPPVHHVVEAQRETRTDRRHDAVPTKDNQTQPGSQDHSSHRSVLPYQTEKALRSTARAQSGPNHATPLAAPIQPPRPIIAARTNHQFKDEGHHPLRRESPEFLPPPPKRNLIPSAQAISTTRESPLHTPPTTSRSSSIAPALPSRVGTEDFKSINSDPIDSDAPNTDAANAGTPDNSQSNRRPPKTKYGASRVWTQYDTRSMDLFGNYACTGGYVFRAWDITNSRMITDYAPDQKELKITSFTFRPGGKPEEEGLVVWIGNNIGEIREIDLKGKVILESRLDAHGKREIVKMFRFQNFIWSLDDEGKLLVWPCGNDGVPSLKLSPNILRVARGHSCSIIIKNHLWIASGRNIHVYNPMAGEDRLNLTLQPLSITSVAEITSTAVISSRLDTVYFSHSDGKISYYSTNNFSCLGLISASSYKINCLVGAGVYLWAGFNTGVIQVYDTQSKPWKVKKEWQAHPKNPVSSIVVDLSSVWKFGHLQVASLGGDNAICFWDGMLEDDWIENDMRQHDTDFCTFEEISAAIMTWNAGASTPGSLRHDQKDSNFFREAIRMDDTPDILVFGFQELVDLEDKKLTAKSIFKGSQKKDPLEADHMSHQYRAWRDYLTQLVENCMPHKETYSILHTASMVGLFTCVFVKSHLRNRIRNLKVAQIKRGLGGLHGNKGAIILRFILADTSICFTNCHLAAGQSQTASRNSDITAILDAAVLPEEKDFETRLNHYIGGGDGAMITDHEICIINGDLNYRIDTMSRDTVIKALKSSNLAKLLERDQLLVSKRRNPGFRLRLFREQAISFAPTYKYDVGTDQFDTSEKGRSPAWCDRILYRGFGCVKQVDYKRHELKLSDHRPVSGLFLMRIKTVDQKRRAKIREQSEDRLADMREALARDAKLGYLVNILGIREDEAGKMLDQQDTF